MFSLVRVSLIRTLNVPKNAKIPFVQNGVRSISGKTMRVKIPTPKPAPYDYHNKGYNKLTSLFDKTSSRFDENSKLIVVEGPVAAGKTRFAQELAEELEMLYLPEANLDMIYINDYGFDLRKLDEQLPESCRSFDVNDFMLNPKHRLVANFQLRQYEVKFSQYIDALAHIYSTGQGVILDRCVFSDFVFVEAMYNQGYLSRGARSVYYEIRKNSINEILRPHLIIYLDVPVNKVMDNIKKRNISYEAKSSVLTSKYLSVMDQHYKQKYLKDMSEHTELLVYDWSNEGEVEVVVEDIERINFVNDDDQNPKFGDWMIPLEEDYAIARHKYADQKDFLMTYRNVPRFDVPELVIEAEDAKIAREVYDSAPGNEYAKGYNTKLGDSGYLFKMSYQHRRTLPIRERRTF